MPGSRFEFLVGLQAPLRLDFGLSSRYEELQGFFLEVYSGSEFSSRAKQGSYSPVRSCSEAFRHSPLGCNAFSLPNAIVLGPMAAQLHVRGGVES